MTTEPMPVGAAIPERLKRLAEERGLDLTVAADLDDTRGETPEERAERLARANAHRLARWSQRLPALYEDASLDDLDPASEAFAWFTRTASATLVLAGGVGTGKTHAAYAIGNHAVRQGVWTEAATVHDLLEALRPSGDAALAMAAKRCDLLVLDDLGATKPSEWAADELTALLDERLRHRRRQIVTTNHPYAVLEESWGPRLLDRLAYRWTIQTMTGESRRRAAW